MAAKKPPRMVATVQINAGKREFAPGDPIEPSDLPADVWDGLVRKGRIVDRSILEAEAGIAELRRLNDAGQAALDELKASAAE